MSYDFCRRTKTTSEVKFQMCNHICIIVVVKKHLFVMLSDPFRITLTVSVSWFT